MSSHHIFNEVHEIVLRHSNERVAWIYECVLIRPNIFLVEAYVLNWDLPGALEHSVNPKQLVTLLKHLLVNASEANRRRIFS